MRMRGGDDTMEQVSLLSLPLLLVQGKGAAARGAAAAAGCAGVGDARRRPLATVGSWLKIASN